MAAPDSSSARLADRKSLLGVRAVPEVRRSARGPPAALGLLPMLLPLLLVGCRCGVRGLLGVCSCTTLLLRLRMGVAVVVGMLPMLPGRRMDGCCWSGVGMFAPDDGRGWLTERPGVFTGSVCWSLAAGGVCGRGCRTCSGFISRRDVPAGEPMVRACSACPAGSPGPDLSCVVGSWSSSSDQDRGVGS